MLKQVLKSMIPSSLIGLLNKVRIPIVRWRNRGKSTAEVFTEIYAKNKWGIGPDKYCSGDGSVEEIALPYCDYINQYLSANYPDGVTIVDLGCGDFRVGQHLLGENRKYIGVDIVSGLVDSLRERYASEEVTFVCLNIIEDTLPDGDVCLVRQVLQHLSNAQITDVLKALGKYKVVFITEHYPVDDSGLVPNKDKPHGEDIRLYDNSAVYLDKPPFGLAGVDCILTIPHAEWGELRTFRIEQPST